MCNCIQEMEQRIIQEQPVKRLEIIRAKFPRSIFAKNGRHEMRYQFKVSCMGRGFKGRKFHDVFITHCPFCGERLYPD